MRRVLGVLLLVLMLGPSTAAHGAAGADLHVKGLRVEGGRIAGGSITVTGTSVNGGAAAAGASRTVIALSKKRLTSPSRTPSLLRSVSVRPLPAGKRAPFKAVATVPAGQTGPYFVVVCADATRRVAESSERNNCASRPLAIQPPPAAPAQPAPPGSIPAAQPQSPASPTPEEPTPEEPNPEEPNPEEPNPEEPILPTLSIADAGGTEGDHLQFVVSLSSPLNFDLNIPFTTEDGSATAGVDYTASSNSVTIPTGSTSAVLEISAVQDTRHEADEAFGVELSATGAVAEGDSSAAGTITDDDPFAVEGVTATSNTSVDVVFNAAVDGASVVANGQQFAFDNGLLATAASAGGDTVTVTTTSQSAIQYTVLVAGVTAFDGAALAPGGNSAAFSGSEP